MAELHQDNPEYSLHEEEQAPNFLVSILEILRDNWVLARSLIFFILMLAVPLIVAWKLDLFLVANP